MNGNIVRYDARVRADGTLDGERPVTAYWLLGGQANRREQGDVTRAELPGFLAPRVAWIELRGVDRTTGAPLSERLDNG